MSQYLTLDPVAKKSDNATNEQTTVSEDLELVTLVDNNGKLGEKYAEILSKEISGLNFYKSWKFEFGSKKDSVNNSLAFIPGKIATKGKRLLRSRKNKDYKTVHDIDNSLKTKNASD
jgi:hypothetical protein